VESSSREERREAELPFAVCFEVEPVAGGLRQYLALAANLRPDLDRIPGFLSIERSRSVPAEGRLLSLSYWADEAAVVAWRSHGSHHEAQVMGRNELFADYRLRVGQVIRRWTPESTHSAVHPATHGLLGLLRLEGLKEADRVAAIFANGSVEFARYESMVNRGRTFFVVSLPDEDARRAVEANLKREAAATQDQLARGIVFDTCEIQRDYGRFERTQAPQFFPPIPQPAF
jgi:heme-degrading monooxygenase HmoA